MGSISASPTAGDFAVAFCFAVGIGFLRYLLDVFVYQKMAIRILCNGQSLLKIDDAKHAKIVKFSESMWKLTYLGIVLFWVLRVLFNEDWSRDTKEYFRGWPNHELKFSMKYLYMWQCGFYIYSIVALLTWETRRKDFSIMMSHHIVTTVLIAYSYLTRFFRIGSIILVLHDACDIFMEAAKVFIYSKVEMGATICFGLFAVAWLLLRLIFFPFWVIRASSYHSIVLLGHIQNYTLMYYVFNTMLFTLLIFHIYWWMLIFSMILKQLKNRGKVGEDIRSDSEDDD